MTTSLQAMLTADEIEYWRWNRWIHMWRRVGRHVYCEWRYR